MGSRRVNAYLFVNMLPQAIEEAEKRSLFAGDFHSFKKFERSPRIIALSLNDICE
ncbi:hypothetical protein AwEntero_26810 [Enterobacterales bacterium]|nr:hypothetical protein AwEntero_26810 [Enterobacterales bacterium]